MSGKKSIARRYAELVMGLRWPIMIGVLILSAIFAYFIKDLDMRNDPDTLLPPSNKYVATNLYAESNYGMGNIMVLGFVVKDGDIYQDWFINLVQEVHRKLEALPHARPANSISLAAQKIKYMSADENGLIFKRLIPTSGISSDPAEAKEQLEFLKEGMEGNPVMSPMLVYMEDANGNKCPPNEYAGCTAKGTFIITDYTDDVKAMYLPWVTELLETIKPYQEDGRLEILVAGEPYFLAYMLYDLAQKWWLFVVSLLIVLVILWIEFRNWRGAIFPLVGVGFTICLTLGLMGISQFKLTTMMVLTPMLLLAIGIGHSVQITRRFLHERTKVDSDKEAGIIAIEHTIVPATLAIVTDVLGFATLALVEISFYKAYAYFGMFGMATLLITTTTMIPLLLVTMPFKKSDIEAHSGEEDSGWENAVGNGLAKLLGGAGKMIPIGIIVAVIVVSTYFTKIYAPTEDSVMPGVEVGVNFPRAAFKASSITIKDIVALNKIMPGVISVSIPIRGKVPNRPECTWEDGEDRSTCNDEDEDGPQGIFNNDLVLADMEKFETWLRNHPSIGYTGSYAQYIRLINMLLDSEAGGKPDVNKLFIPTSEALQAFDPEDDRSGIEMVRLYNGLLESMTSEGDMDSFVSADWNEGVILGFVNTMDPVETHQVVLDIQEYIEQHQNDEGFKQVNFGLRCGPVGQIAIDCDTNEFSIKDSGSYQVPGVGGFLGATEASRDAGVDNFIQGPMQTALAIFIVAALIFRSIPMAMMLLVILLTTLYAQYGLGGYFTTVKNWSGVLAFHTQVSLSIAMGLGVDYGIYVISRLREEMQATGRDWDESLRNTLTGTGSAVIVSVIVLLGSFVPLVSTELANTWALGVYISLALIIDVFLALMMLPLAIKWLKPKYVFEPEDE